MPSSKKRKRHLATISFTYTDKSSETFQANDEILMYDTENNQLYEVFITLKEFFEKIKLRKRIRIKEENKRKEYLKHVISIISILKNISNKKD